MLTNESLLTFNEIIGKPFYYLYRPVVQQQLIAILIAIFLAWLLTRWLKPWLQTLLPVEEEVAAPEVMYTQEFDEAKAEITDTTVALPEVKKPFFQQW
ncbi:MAG: hypothetical protein KDI62_24275, partial [Anaerolineae bacterium]|nr:hypothetical protein [Anaerolineae bacterium]